MELRGHRRANKPQSGLFSRHYYTGSGRKKQAGGEPALSCAPSFLQGGDDPSFLQAQKGWQALFAPAILLPLPPDGFQGFDRQKVTTSWAGFSQGPMATTFSTGPLP